MKNVTANPAEKALAEAFKASQKDRASDAKLSAIRDDAFGRFFASGLPTRRVEAWHYTDLRNQMREAFPIVERPNADAITSARQALDALPPSRARIVLVDGWYVEELSAIDSNIRASVSDLNQQITSADDDLLRDISGDGLGADDGALSLNAALMNGGVLIDIAAGAKLDAPVEIVQISIRQQKNAQYTRSVVQAGAGSDCVLVERHIDLGSAPLQKNDALIVSSGDGAKLAHIFVQQGAGAERLHINSLILHAGEGAKLSSFGLVDNGDMVRRQIFARFSGPNAALELAGLVLAREKNHLDTTLVVEHVYPDCTSSEYFKHIIEESATGVFQGKISVAPEAQKTDGAMKSQTILLSDNAAMYNKPELEIFADDVLCGHGATCGALDPNQLFYAMSRGLTRADAEALLLEAFGADAIEHAELEETHADLAGEITNRLRQWLAARQFQAGRKA